MGFEGGGGGEVGEEVGGAEEGGLGAEVGGGEMRIGARGVAEVAEPAADAERVPGQGASEEGGVAAAQLRLNQREEVVVREAGMAADVCVEDFENQLIHQFLGRRT